MHMAVVLIALLGLAFAGAQTTSKPFKANAKIGVPFTLGLQDYVHGTREKVDTGTLRVLTLSSARLAAIYPNRLENVSAGAGEKLLVLRGTLKNPSAVEMPVSSSSLFALRFWDGRGKGEFKYVGAFDPETHDYVRGTLRKGQSLPFECVLRIPARFDPFRVGFYYRERVKTAWYDFSPNLGKMTTTFSPDGSVLADRARAAIDQPFDFETFRMKVLSASGPTSIGGSAPQPWTVSVEVTNAMLLPARWGWQYVTPELVMKDGSVLKAAPDLIDRKTGKTWSGDLPGGATMTAQFVFRPAEGQVPVAFRLTALYSRRTIEVPF